MTPPISSGGIEGADPLVRQSAPRDLSRIQLPSTPLPRLLRRSLDLHAAVRDFQDFPASTKSAKGPDAFGLSVIDSNGLWIPWDFRHRLGHETDNCLAHSAPYTNPGTVCRETGIDGPPSDGYRLMLRLPQRRIPHHSRLGLRKTVACNRHPEWSLLRRAVCGDRPKGGIQFGVPDRAECPCGRIHRHRVAR